MNQYSIKQALKAAGQLSLATGNKKPFLSSSCGCSDSFVFIRDTEV